MISLVICSAAIARLLVQHRHQLLEMFLGRLRGSYAAGRQLSLVTASMLRSGAQPHLFNTLPQRRRFTAASPVGAPQEPPQQNRTRKDLAVTLHGLFGVSVLWSRIHTQLENSDFIVAHFRYVCFAVSAISP